MPFRSGGFDAIMCGYSLRDAIGLRIAISEAHRVLRKGGRFVIVDLGKPDSRFVRVVWDFISDSYFHSSHTAQQDGLV